MTSTLYFIGILFLLGGVGACAIAKSAPHEIEGLMGLLIGLMLITAGAILEKLQAIRAVLDQLLARLPKPPTQ